MSIMCAPGIAIKAVKAQLLLDLLGQIRPPGFLSCGKECVCKLWKLIAKCKYHFMDQPEFQKQILMYSLGHLLEIAGWIQDRVAREHKLKPLDVALLRRADRHGSVSFDRIRHDTAVAIHTISRAAHKLEDRKLGSVRLDKRDGRRRRFHIADPGKELLLDIEFKIAQRMAYATGATSLQSRRYYNFTVHLWNLTRFLPDCRVAMPNMYFPTDIRPSDKVTPEQQTFEQFIRDLEAEPRLGGLAPRTASDLLLSD